MSIFNRIWVLEEAGETLLLFFAIKAIKQNIICLLCKSHDIYGVI